MAGSSIWANRKFKNGASAGTNIRRIFTTASVIPAIYQARDKAVAAVFKAAAKHQAFANVDPKSLKMTRGRVHEKDKAPTSDIAFDEILKSQRLAGLDGQGKTMPSEELKKNSIHSFGVHFCEVAWDPESSDYSSFFLFLSDHHSRVSSTRRLRARPSKVSLRSIGRDLP